jgi:hypothetical protein
MEADCCEPGGGGVAWRQMVALGRRLLIPWLDFDAGHSSDVQLM